MNVSISLKNNSDRERITKDTLEKLLVQYSLDKWILCPNVVIEQDVIAHSHPAVTIACWRNYDEGLLAQFLHNQTNGIEEGKEEQMDKAIEDLKQLFPHVPVGKPKGSNNEKSTYRHLIICRLELLALSEVLGNDKAIEVTLNNK